MAEIPHTHVSPDVARQQKEFGLPPEHPHTQGKEDGRAFYGFLTGDTTVDFFHGGKYTSEREKGDYNAGFVSVIQLLVQERLEARGLLLNGIGGVYDRGLNITRALYEYHEKLALSVVGQASPIEIAQCAKDAYGALGENGLFNFPSHSPQNT